MGCNDGWTEEEVRAERDRKLTELMERCNLLIRCLCDTIRRNRALPGFVVNESTSKVWKAHSQQDIEEELNKERQAFARREVKTKMVIYLAKEGDLPDPARYQELHGLAERAAYAEFEKSHRREHVYRQTNLNVVPDSALAEPTPPRGAADCDSAGDAVAGDDAGDDRPGDRRPDHGA